jgi:ribosomal protein S19
MKIPFVDYKLYTSVKANASLLHNVELQQISGKTVLLTKSRSSVIAKPFIGKVLSIYQGKFSKRIRITKRMKGHHLGEFSFTKKMGKSIHNSERNRKKKEKMRRKITQKKVRKPKTTKK